MMLSIIIILVSIALMMCYITWSLGKIVPICRFMMERFEALASTKLRMLESLKDQQTRIEAITTSIEGLVTRELLERQGH